VQPSILAGRVRAIVAIVVCLTASSAWGQEPPPRDESAQPSVTELEPVPVAPSIPIGAYPLELLGLLAPPAQRGPLTLTPSLSVSEEFNDNIFSDNQNREWDFITGFTPALTLHVNQPGYQLSAGYSFTADVYARESRLNSAFARQNFLATGFYQLTQGLTVTASDAFTYDRNSNRVTTQNFSTGSQESWTNHFAPGLSWQMTPRNNLSLGATYGLLRYSGAGSAVDSDTYGFHVTLTHAFTSRFSGNIGYNFTFLNLRVGDDSTTHSPTVGFSYALTPTLSASITGGASITELGGDTFVNPTGTLSLVQVFSFGSASLQYHRGISVAGGFGGTNDTQTASGTLAISTLLKGLVVVFQPSYNESNSVNSAQSQSVDVKSVTVFLGATYQIARYTSLFGGYTFFWQRGGSSTNQNDVDQNRVRFGLQFGYPINFFD
jgi:hypothetical protein